MSVQRDNAWRERITQELRASHGSSHFSSKLAATRSPRSRFTPSPSRRSRLGSGWESPSSSISSDLFSCHNCGAPNQLYCSPRARAKTSTPQSRPVYRPHHHNLDIDAHSESSAASSPRPARARRTASHDKQDISSERRSLHSDLQRLNKDLEKERQHRRQLTAMVKQLAAGNNNSDDRRAPTSPGFYIQTPPSHGTYRTHGGGSSGRQSPPTLVLPNNLSPAPVSSYHKNSGGYVGRSFSGRSIKQLNPTKDRLSSEWQGELRSPERRQLVNTYRPREA